MATRSPPELLDDPGLLVESEQYQPEDDSGHHVFCARTVAVPV